MEIIIKDGVCLKCHKNLSVALELLGEKTVTEIHKASHQREAFKDLLIRWRDRLNPVFIKELEEIIE